MTLRIPTCAAALALLAVARLPAAGPFSDVPAGHWAYGAIERAVAAGILEGDRGKFHGERTVSRFEFAVVVDRFLRKGQAPAGSAGLSEVEKLTHEFADELSMLGTRVMSAEGALAGLRMDLATLKAGSGARPGKGRNLSQAFSGFLAVALVDNDSLDPAATLPVRNRYNRSHAPDQTFFTLPQASLAIDTEVGEGLGLHMQIDYNTDAASLLLPVGINEAYLTVDELFGSVGAKIGAFAFPWTNWEINGPFRTLDQTISPSAMSTFFEFYRAIGIELSPGGDADPEKLQWRLGVFTGGDLAATGGSNRLLGHMQDLWTAQDLAFQNTFDDQPGFYLELESGRDPGKAWGWRVGWFDLGGDPDGAGLPPVPGAAPPSGDVDGWQIGFWWKRDRFKVMAQLMDAENDEGNPVGANDLSAWYLLLNYRIDDRQSVSLRYDSWETAPPLGVAPTAEGDGITLAYNRRIDETSMLQLEFLSPEEETGAGVPDQEDDQIQLRYKVWF